MYSIISFQLKKENNDQPVPQDYNGGLTFSNLALRVGMKYFF